MRCEELQDRSLIEWISESIKNDYEGRGEAESALDMCYKESTDALYLSRDVYEHARSDAPKAKRPRLQEARPAE